MKILKKGRPQMGWAKECICTGGGNGKGGCGAKLLVEQADLFHTYSSHYDGSNETHTTFRCVGCGVLTDIKVPPDIKVYANEKVQEAARCRVPDGQ